ncbi:hypothetical protein EG68_01136 [Paragonimus skrjabini miyazakii]|uniref:Fas-associated factor 1/2-like UAS domain-containing protein n=1 Tax=Paragonimus skrjabini miyazakii TaxID=59628 RepID=A0A8S9Z8G9_9TREM|nr:hypothetical protein EG68_01136 [Paragonimus skrjabini miyazakii]
MPKNKFVKCETLSQNKSHLDLINESYMIAPGAAHDDLPSESKTYTTDGLNISETSALDRYISKIHSNLLTSEDQAALTQQFCVYFYHRYCTALGDLLDPDPGNSWLEKNNSDLKHPDPLGERVSAMHEAQSKPLCPFFYTGSLAEAVKLCERPPGRPWPVVLLYLHHEESPHTHRFVQDILCSLYDNDRDEIQVADATTPMFTVPNVVITTRNETDSVSKSDREVLIQSATIPRVISTPSLAQMPPPPNSLGAKVESVSATTPCKSRRSNPALGRVRSQQGGCDRAKVGNCIRKSLFRVASNVSIHLADSQIGSMNDHVEINSKLSSSSRVKSFVRPRGSKRPNATKSISNKETNNAARKPLFPDQNCPNDYGEDIQPESTRSDGGINYRVDNITAETDERTGGTNPMDDGKAYCTVYKSKSFRGLLLERSAGLVPWNCTLPRMRAYLLSAFAATRLSQWLKEWQKPCDYPVLVAVGRTAEREVVCSQLKGASATRTSALHWLNEVTLAHFSNYRRMTIPTCPERSEAHTITPPNITSPLPGDSCGQMNIYVDNLAQQPNPTIPVITSGRTTAVTGELTEHTFTSLPYIRQSQNDRNISSRMQQTKLVLSPTCPEEVVYRVTKTPQQQEGPLSFLFEQCVEKPSERFREQLKLVQTSFRLANASMEKILNFEYLRNLGIDLEEPMEENWEEPTKKSMQQLLVATLCKTDGFKQVPSRRRENAVTPTVNEPVESFSRTNEFTEKMPFKITEASFKADRTFGDQTPHSNDHDRLRSTRSKYVVDEPPVTGTGFYEEFKKHFVLDFPSTPPFLLGRLQTAVLRSVNILHSQQTSPLLIYLHDSHAFGAAHFVANVLCSRRFSSKLFDHGLYIWPLDVTDVRKNTTVITEARYCTKLLVKCHQPDPVNGIARVVEEQMKQRSRMKSWSLTPTKPLKHTKRCLPQRTEGLGHLQMTSANNVGSPSKIAEFNWKATGSLESAEKLLQYFEGHPANETFGHIFKIPILPTLVNVYYTNKMFCITHILLPSATTKEAMSWLSSVLKFFYRLKPRTG